MTTRERCKGCKIYLTVPPGQPCPVCYRVRKPEKKARHYIVPQILQYADGYTNGVSSTSYHNSHYGQPLQTSSYGGYYDPSLEANYYAPPQAPTPVVYGDSYYGPWPQGSASPTVYSDSYYSPWSEVPSPPTVYIDSYNSPQPQELPPRTVYSNCYYRPNTQVSRPMNNGDYQQAPRVHEKKRAVLCGVTYKGHRKTLEASLNNIRNMHKLLVRLGFPNASIRILTEEESEPTRTPTKRNILMALEWLAKDCQSGDSLVFYYAGHGSHVPDNNGDEKDGFDEALCPVDYRVAGKILDDEINATIVAPLPDGAILHSIIDTCFSGTLLDLPFLCRIDQGGFYDWEDHCPSHAPSCKGTSGGKAICISACDDHQNSADTSAFTGNAIGALTYSFIQAVQSIPKLTYGDLLGAMRQKVHEAQELHGLNAPFASSISQEPQLSCSTRFEIYSEIFML